MPRRLYMKPARAGVGGMLVMAARGSTDLGAALGIVFVFAVVALVAFIAGAAFDITDSARVPERAKGTS